MAKDKSGVIGDVMAEIEAAAPKPTRWYERVATEHAAMLAELRQAWADGRLGKSRSRAARSIASVLKARGIASIGEQGVESWLGKQ